MSPSFRPRRASRAATALVTLLVTSLAAPAAFADGSGTPQISDSFSGNSINTSTWWYGTNAPNAVAISQAEGHVTVSVSGHAPSDFNASLGTRCRAHGDFDARVAFDFTAWPVFDGVWVALMAFDGQNLLGNVYRASGSWGDSSGVWGPTFGGTAVPAAGTHGVMRLVRQGATMTGYYLVGGRWVAVFTGPVPLSDANFNLTVSNNSNATPFGGDWATIHLSNFVATADAITCS
jgi:hypothetical protein